MESFSQLELDLSIAQSSGDSTAVEVKAQSLPEDDRPVWYRSQLSEGQMLWWKFFVECECRDVWKAAINHPDWLAPLTQRLSALPSNR